jgi:hypothetical protein
LSWLVRSQLTRHHRSAGVASARCMTAISHSCTVAGDISRPPSRPRTPVIRSLLARIASADSHDVVVMHSPDPRSTIIDNPTKPSTSSRVDMASSWT